MNFATLIILLGAGFGISFIVLDVSRVAARRHWPSASGAVADNFQPFAIFLALFAGPALFARAVWRMHASGALSFADVVLAVVIACGWACCYGLVVLRGVGLMSLSAH